MRRCLALVAAGALSSQLFALELQAKSAIVVDERSGVALWGKDPHSIRYPASITKLMTALLLIEHTEPNEAIYASPGCETVEGASLHLKAGERISAGDLLKGILLRSANDGSHAAAVHIAGSDQRFAELMNARARDLGCRRTNFVNPHGLHHDRHYTTAYDMALIAREAMRHPEIREIVAKRRARIERSLNTQDTYLISKNKWLEHDPTGDGIKTGYTRAARSTFVGSATRGGVRFITVLLGSEAWEDDQKALVNWAFREFRRTRLLARGQEVGRLPVAGGQVLEVPAGLDEDVFYAAPAKSGPRVRTTVVPRPGLTAPIEAGEEIGHLSIEDGKGWRARRKLYALGSVAAAPIAASPGFWAIALALGASTWAVRKRSKRIGAAVRPR